MKAKNVTPHPLAVLTTEPTNGLAVLTATLDSNDDGWYQLLPAGAFNAPDGRPTDTESGHWYLDAESAEAFIAATKATRSQVLVDYDHQTLYTEQTGKPAPAAAWLKADTDIEWREGKGIYVRPDWTKNAQKHINEREYAFLSAVFPYDKKTGKPFYLRMAALTNDPGLTSLESVAALSADFNVNLSKQGVSINLYGTTEEQSVNELLKKLLGKLGIELTGDLTDEQATAALTAVDAALAGAAKLKDTESELAVLKAKPPAADPSLQKAYDGVVAELAVLKAGTDQTSIESTLKKAREQGKIVEAETDYLTNVGKLQGLAALTAMLDARAPIAALTATQTATTTVVDGKDKHEQELTESDLAVLKATAMDKDAFLKAKQEI
ncbi:phage protease [Vibrio mediterranei]|uniref:phage protease n=1 Tax=Vibrio mediterranei TaxID=689 RepID=UPI001EFEE19E|nr:phage protease [Vibrio mediterranei]MCG9624634.1 phage protease [Vibrio mediterranei]